MEQVIAIAQNNHYDGIIMCNLYAYKATNPEDMRITARVKEAVGIDGLEFIKGPMNQQVLQQTANNPHVHDVVFAYGGIAMENWKIGGFRRRCVVWKNVVQQMMVDAGKNVFAFRRLAPPNRFPGHPYPRDDEYMIDRIRRSVRDAADPPDPNIMVWERL